jgi:hexosaminidase
MTYSLFLFAAILAVGCDAYEGNKQKYQVLMPQPQSHSSGVSTLWLGAAEISSISEAAEAAGKETLSIVASQFLARMPDIEDIATARKSTLQVLFLHKLPEWRGASSWQPIRQRNESYGLAVSDNSLVVDAQSSWALANAMATLYQLTEVKKARVSILGCPHRIVDTPAFAHRGLLVDVARTFLPVSFLKDLIVQLGEFKLNVLHLHLTDSASWPVEIDTHPELTAHLSYKDINDERLTYSRTEVRDMVEFARLRGVSLVPEIDGPAHAPAFGFIEPLRLTVAADSSYSTGDFAVEPPAGSWNYSNASVTATLNDVFQQLEQDFVTAPYLHVGGDEPRASSLCAALTDEAKKSQCLQECTQKGGGSPYAPNCAVLAGKPNGANGTYWFPEVLNEQIQNYFNEVVPADIHVPLAAWSGVRTDMGVTLSKKSDVLGKPTLQLWQFPASNSTPGLTTDDCDNYDIIQSSATHPQGPRGSADAGWMYLECGAGQNWISMGASYWCSRASWVSMYSQNLTQHYEPAMKTPQCQRAFVGAEIGIWGEITGTGNSMSLIFPRAVAFAERAWTNPRALTWTDLTATGAPPFWYWQDHLKDALGRLNTIV